MNTQTVNSGFFQRLRAALATGDYERDFRAWILTGVAALMTVVGTALAVDDLLTGHYSIAAVIMICPLAMLAAILLIAYRNDTRAAAMIVIGGLFVADVIVLVLFGGRSTGAYVFLPAILVIAATAESRRFAIVTAAGCVAVLIFGLLLATTHWPFPFILDTERAFRGAVRISIVTGAICFYCMLLYSRASDRLRERLVDAQALSLQSQKLESIGTLAAGVAHEINTPVQYVSDNLNFIAESCAQLKTCIERISAVAGDNASKDTQLQAAICQAMQDNDIDFALDELPQALKETGEGLRRIRSIVQAMKVFSHPGQESRALVDINEAVQSTLVVCRNRWKAVAEVITDFDESLPAVDCKPDEINQVILNIIVNAADAINESIVSGRMQRGEIRVSTRRRGKWVEIEVADNGPGIPDDVRQRIFDPFFTTKEVGHGTGQGLAISWDVVVNRHGGELLCASHPDKGTRFRVRLPVTDERAALPPDGQR